MHINKNLLWSCLLILSGCATTQTAWHSEYGSETTGSPTELMYGHLDDTTINGATKHRMAVMLPLSGTNAPTGQTIRSSIEMAILQKAPQNLSVSFYDTASDNFSETVSTVLQTNPEIIIGPLFAADTKIVREAKDSELPVLAFTSDATAVGNGVMSMSLMPTNSIEAIMSEMAKDKIEKFIIFAPNTDSGKLMAGAALNSANINDISNIGIFYYTENNSVSIKDIAKIASMNNARHAAHNRAREILSDILNNEDLSTSERYSLNKQLENLSKTDTLGKIPYNGILFLGNGSDTKELASFLRYFGLSSHNVKFYGTAMWSGADITNDLTMQGSKYATLPEPSQNFSYIYSGVYNQAPFALASFGYDAATLAIGMIYSNKTKPAYLLDPSGFIGTNGLFRLKPNGDNERALHIVQLNGNNQITPISTPAQTFIKPMYYLSASDLSPASSQTLISDGIRATDYIDIPTRFSKKYKSKLYGANYQSKSDKNLNDSVLIIQSDEPSIISDDFQPQNLEKIDRTYIDSIEMND